MKEFLSFLSFIQLKLLKKLHGMSFYGPFMTNSQWGILSLQGSLIYMIDLTKEIIYEKPKYHKVLLYNLK